MKGLSIILLFIIVGPITCVLVIYNSKEDLQGDITLRRHIWDIPKYRGVFISEVSFKSDFPVFSCCRVLAPYCQSWT